MSSVTHSTPTHQRGLFYAMIALLFTTACAQSESTFIAPTPTPSASGVTSVTIAAISVSAGKLQLAATAHSADSTTRDVTSLAQWESSNPALATVSAGAVTVTGNGEVDFRATYQSQTGTLRLTVMPGKTVSLSGVVHEVQPSERTVPGVRVEITEGADAGRFVLTDQAGVYRFPDVSMGPVSMTATMTGFQPWRVDRLNMSTNMELDAWLVRVPPKDANGVSATLRCKDGSWSWSQDRLTACAANGGIAYIVCPGPFCKDSAAN